LVFHMTIYPDSNLQLDDVVATSREVTGRGQVLTSGIVTDVRSRHEGASFSGDVFLISEVSCPMRVQGGRRSDDHPGQAGVLRTPKTA